MAEVVDAERRSGGGSRDRVAVQVDGDSVRTDKQTVATAGWAVDVVRQDDAGRDRVAQCTTVTLAAPFLPEVAAKSSGVASSSAAAKRSSE
jgi:hypothetical protein